MRLAALLILAGLPGVGVACEALTEGRGLPGRYTEAEIRNAGQVENWAPDGARLVFHAGYDVLTDEYGHGVLGAVRDAKHLTIHLRLPGDARITCPSGVVLPEGEVFEDIAPRLADLDGDGMPEVIAVQSSVTGGARLAVYDRRGRLLDATPPIGRRNRWLAPVGAADFDGDGRMDIAYVETPHLGKTLRVWAWDGGRLVEVAAASGVTNHRIGDETIAGGVRDCGDGPEMILADGTWGRFLAVRLEGGRPVSRDLGRFSAPSMARALACG